MDNRKALVKRTKLFGRGVFAKAKIRKGEEIASFDGPYYGDIFNAWTEDLLNHAIQCGPDMWRDSVGIARLINHSCEANCGIKSMFKIVAMRDIEKGEHITWDYEMTERSEWWKMRCKCGSPKCRKRIGDYRNMPLEARRRYKGYISAWLKR